MNITQLVFSWPKDAQYSCEPDSYEGWAIEDYDFEISGSTLALGDVRSWEGQLWRVVQMEDYFPANGSANRFSVAVLTLDGQIPQRDHWDGSEQRLMYVCVSPDDVLFGLPEHPEALPELGSEVHDMPGWVATSVREFEPATRGSYDQVLVYWCAAAIVPQPESVAA